MVINGVGFFVSLSTCYLLKHRNTIEFCVLLLYAATILNLHISSRRFLVDSLGFSMQTVWCKAKIKAQYYVLPWYLANPGWPWMHICQFPSPLCCHGYGLLDKQPSLCRGPGRVPSYNWVVSFSSLQPVKLFKQASHILLREPEATSLSWYYKARLPCSCLFILSWVKLLWGPVWHAVCSSLGLWVYVINRLLSVSSVQCHMLCIWPFL